MIKIEDKIKCTGCSACMNICPVNAITMKTDSEGFLYPCVEYKKCILCNLCENACPYITRIYSPIDLEICYTAYNPNEKEREISSSGGIFVLLAKNIIRKGGIVWGAAFDENFTAVHTYIESENDLSKLIGSKYMQSRIERAYQSIEKTLQEGRKVLFVGTPCQIGGLKGYLRKEYDNLICVDFICLGVPSPQIWKDYLKTFFYGEKINSVNFKNKSLGWHQFSLNIKTEKRNFCKNGRYTYFFSGYFKQLYSRPSCSQCIFKGENRISDVTLSDCWGYRTIAPELDDNRGLSSVECHTEKGLSIFDEIKPEIVWKKSNIDDVKKYNKNYHMSAQQGEKRKDFWRDYNNLPMKKLFLKYCRPKEKLIRCRVRSIVRDITKRVMR